MVASAPIRRYGTAEPRGRGYYPLLALGAACRWVPALRYSGRAVTARHDPCRRRARVADAGSMPPIPEMMREVC